MMLASGHDRMYEAACIIIHTNCCEQHALPHLNRHRQVYQRFLSKTHSAQEMHQTQSSLPAATSGAGRHLHRLFKNKLAFALEVSSDRDLTCVVFAQLAVAFSAALRLDRWPCFSNVLFFRFRNLLTLRFTLSTTAVLLVHVLEPLVLPTTAALLFGASFSASLLATTAATTS
jgi:hypothetical protein